VPALSVEAESSDKASKSDSRCHVSDSESLPEISVVRLEDRIPSGYARYMVTSNFTYTVAQASAIHVRYAISNENGNGQLGCVTGGQDAGPST
jgi:hypothetical protein